MTRGTRSKSRTPKNSEDVMTKCDDSPSVNCTINVDIANSSSDSFISSNLSKKRNATECDSIDTTTVNRSPPTKKRHLNDLTRVNRSSQKRQNDTPVSEIEEYNPVKVQKVASNIHRAWTKIVQPDVVQSANSNSDANSLNNNFVIASYNIEAIAASFHSSNLDTYAKGVDQHELLMEELSFIDADIFCLQQISMDHWKVLEDSLRGRGFRSSINVTDGDRQCGVATFYRMSRFVQVKFESDKLSKLCLQNIHHNNVLDEETMNSIKKYLDEPESYIVTLLRDLKHERLLIVGNTRLSDDKDNKPDLKCVQVAGLFWCIYKMICQIQTDHDNNNIQAQQMLSPCWILCGDLNGSVDSPVYQICRDGYPSESTIERLQAVKKVFGDCNKTSSLIDLIWNSFQHPFTDSCNSYLKCHDASPDCIWTSEKALKTHQVLLPNSGCGQSTDGAVQDGHLSLACDVAFVT